MEVFEIEIDQLIPSSRILRKNDGAGSRMIAEFFLPTPAESDHLVSFGASLD